MNKCCLLIVVSLVVMMAVCAQASEYKVGTGDILSISFWQDPALNSDVRVNQDGKISLDVVGEIDAAGRTTAQLEVDIVRRMSRLNKNISQAVVRVTAFNHQYVFVTGQVNDGGKWTFEEIPDLWSIINEAGGVTEIGDLSRVTIIRGGDNAGQVEIVNVSAAIANGTMNELPKIRREDTIEIPRMPIGFPSPELGTAREKKNLIYVVGAVGLPGPITFEENVDVLEAIALAGGPTAMADLRKTKVITKDGYFGQTIQLDLDKYTRLGTLTRYTMQKEDVVVVAARRSSILSIANITGLIGVVTSTVLIWNLLDSNGDSTRE
ncbi:MAG: polysaccharide export protein [candidate division Zixibacteria bacterium]|nr:polysaccharide export protein [candidate division Zixibacteria bacterium]